MLKGIALIVAIVGWFWLVGIVINAPVSAYVKQACGLYLVGSTVFGFSIMNELSGLEAQMKRQTNYIEFLKRKNKD